MPEPAPASPATDAPAAPAPAPVHELRGHQRWLARAAGYLVRGWAGSVRYQWADPALAERVRAISAGVCFVSWHNLILVGGTMARRLRPGRRQVSLVSASRDGAWLTEALRSQKMRTVRGSSSRRGLVAAKEAVKLLREGYDLGITPDGPRGPLHDFKEGAIIIPQLAKAPLALLGIHFGHAYRFKSWDRLWLPYPGTRGVVHLTLVEDIRRFAAGEAPGLALRRALLALTPAIEKAEAAAADRARPAAPSSPASAEGEAD